MGPARQLAVDQSLVKRYSIRAPAGVGRVGCDLNGVLVTLMMILQDERRNFRLLHKTFWRTPAEIYYSGQTRARGHVCHVQHVLHYVEHEVVFLFKTGRGNSHSDPTIGNCGTKNRHASFVS